LAHDPTESAALDFIFRVERYYSGLIARVDQAADSNSDPGLGGKLLYAGELDVDGRALLVATNIAGAASLAATEDAAAQKQAVRDGVADFLVNTLDEGLRILKNQIRKREAVAVCVAAAPVAVESQMLERGVQPDLLRSTQLAEAATGETYLTWQVASASALWLPKLDAIALDCLDAGAMRARRWLRFAPRYLGRLTQKSTVLACDPETAKKFVARVHAAVQSGEIGMQVRMHFGDQDFTAQPSLGAHAPLSVDTP
jgi:Urocanase Rossmann-like domain